MIAPDDEKLLYGQIIGDLMLRGEITYSAFGWIKQFVDIAVESTCFTDESFVTSIDDGEWNGGPGEAVRNELLDLLLSGKLSFKPDFDVEAMCRERQYLTH